ncbi:helix-turn-helix domain-containing protein [Staphylococcus kloosii]|uniref:helix-turn-helix domain-containing protein n=1 Tax=Staphylococcus kloosii TaxID=29384 RepID=UPI00189D6A98|nr:helix-turn-helix transcriptional regulator [Staphylococcus kloosii]MBF7025944.1 helix-turn-helix transcriptional regulator [Staphylococcus kloosii]
MMERNERLRKEMKAFQETYFKPRLGLIATHLKIDRSYLTMWLNGHREVSDEMLDKIEKFLKEYNR